MTAAATGSKRVTAAAGALLLVTALLLLCKGDLQRGGTAARHLLRDARAAAAAATWEGGARQLPPPPYLLSASLAPPPPAPSPEALEGAAEAAAVSAHCSTEHRAQHAAAVANGSTPALLAGGWSCNGIDQCSGSFVSEMVVRWRSMPGRYQSLLDMLPCDLFRQIRNRTLWIVGDSNAQRFYKQLSCFLAPFHWPPGQTVHDKFTYDRNYVELVESKLVKGWEGAGEALPFCMRLLGSTMLCHMRVNFGDHMLHFMKNLDVLNARKQRDIVSFNFGLWHNKRKHFIKQMFAIVNKWVPPLDAGMIQGMADYWKAHRAEMPIMIWRDHSPQHFSWEHGEYPHPDDRPKMKDGTCRRLPVELQPDGTLTGNDTNVLAGGWRNIISLPVWRASGVPIQHTWNDTVVLHGGHTKPGDCTHFCSPGVYNVWIWSLWRSIADLKLPQL